MSTASHTARLNWLRAGVLGANDGIVSVAALLVGVAAATDEFRVLLLSGVASLVAGAVSMALGEYVSVSAQRDTEREMLRSGRLEGVTEAQLVNPWHAAWASAGSFTFGAILPMLAILFIPSPWRIPASVVAVLIALSVTGAVSAHLGDAPKARAVIRVVVGGALALAATWAIGALVGVKV